MKEVEQKSRKQQEYVEWQDKNNGNRVGAPFMNLNAKTEKRRLGEVDGCSRSTDSAISPVGTRKRKS